MDTLVGLHVGLLDKCFATILTLVLFHLKMDLFMPLPRSKGRELLPANRAWQSSEALMCLDVGRQVSLPDLLVADFTFNILKKIILISARSCIVTC